MPSPHGASTPDGPKGPTHEQRGLFFDELEPGARYLHAPGRTLMESDNVLFTTLTMNTQALHLDAHWSSHQPFGRPLVNSLLTLSTLVGASVSQLTQGTIVANLGFESVSFPAPVFSGDTLYSETVIQDARPSRSRPGQGIVSFEHIGTNQEGVIVARCLRSALLWERSAAPAQHRPVPIQPDPAQPGPAEQSRPERAEGEPA